MTEEKTGSFSRIRFRPFKQQMSFHYDRFKYRYRAIFAGTGSGKTAQGVYEAVWWALKNPGSIGLIFEPTYPMIKRILIHENLEHPLFFGSPLEANRTVAHYHKSELRLDLWADDNTISTIYFISLDDPEAAEGSSVDWAHIDEARLIPKFNEAWDSIERRLRGSGRCKTGHVGLWVTTTPPPLIIDPERPESFLYNFFVNPNTRNKYANFYNWSTLDNPFTGEKYKEAVLSRHSGARKDQFVYGKFVPMGLVTYPFDGRIHVLDKVPEPKSFFRFVAYGVDWGWTHPACVLAIGFDGDMRAYVVDEFYQSRCSIEKLVFEAAKMQKKWGAGTFWCDKSEPRSIEVFQDAGLDAVANKTRREEGIHEMGGRFEVQGDGRPRIYVSRKCVNWIAEVQVYDERKKENDDALDACRYVLANMERDIGGNVDISFLKVRK